MPDFKFLKGATRQIAPGQRDWEESGWTDFEEAVDAASLQGFQDDLSGATEARELMSALFGNAPYLRRLAVKDPASVQTFLEHDADEGFEQILAELTAEFDQEIDRDSAKKVLRRAKSRAALLIAMADISGVWRLEEVTGALTRFADTCLDMCVRFLLREQAASGKVRIEGDLPERSCGITFIAMGKYGAGELNYSSDIDIIVLFDPDRVPVVEGTEAQKLAVRLTKNLVTLMQDMTGDGYVFRTDLRLRPDAGATPVALSVDAAGFYYESMGQNWERAAWIKARACAGDLEVGRAFLKLQEPYVWRRYLDYAAIEDIHSIKRQIHAHKGHAEIAIEGHNIKLGRGGIREIEFFAQTQQLIGGGREPRLREITTIGALNALCRLEIIKPEVLEDLSEAYRFLREVEHRLQMVGDEQTHSMPRTAEEVDAIACFCGFDDAGLFRQTLRGHFQKVQRHYAELFEEEPSLGSAHGNLVFTGVEDDPETLKTLASMGFNRPGVASTSIREWHHGRIRVTRSERSRALLTKLVPHLLEAFSRTPDPDAAMANFDRFITGLPAGVQLFSMLHSRPDMIILLADILGTAPRLARTLAQSAGVIDALSDPDFFESFPDAKTLETDFNAALIKADHYEAYLDIARIWSGEMKFRAGVNVMTGRVEPERLGSFFADSVDAIIKGLQPVATAEVARRAGAIDGDMAVIAFGKLGSREMSAESDLDIIFVYDTKDADATSDGPRPLHNTQYFARISQRLISALTAPTSEGQMFEIDTRLRPSGNKGPIAIRFEGFDRYQREEAWTWEKMALTRARVVTGSEELKEKIEETIMEVLTAQKDTVKIFDDVAEMRQRIYDENGSDNPWNLKHVRGGLVDVEFIAQALQLTHGADHPEVFSRNTIEALEKLGGAGVLEKTAARTLMDAASLHHKLTQITRVCVEGILEPDEASETLRSLVARAVGVESFEAAELRLRETQAQIVKLFEELIKKGG